MEFIKTVFFRAVAILLLVFSLGNTVCPDPGTYSSHIAFIKAHSPSGDNYFSLISDDKEDKDEYGAMDIQITACLPTKFFDLYLKKGFAFGPAYPAESTIPKVYILNKQLLI